MVGYFQRDHSDFSHNYNLYPFIGYCIQNTIEIAIGIAATTVNMEDTYTLTVIICEKGENLAVSMSSMPKTEFRAILK